MHSSKGRSQEAKARCRVQSRRPEASANSPSSTPRQRQIKLRAASSLGQPRPIGRCVCGWPATPALCRS